MRLASRWLRDFGGMSSSHLRSMGDVPGSVKSTRPGNTSTTGPAPERAGSWQISACARTSLTTRSGYAVAACLRPPTGGARRPRCAGRTGQERRPGLASPVGGGALRRRRPLPVWHMHGWVWTRRGNCIVVDGRPSRLRTAAAPYPARAGMADITAIPCRLSSTHLCEVIPYTILIAYAIIWERRGERGSKSM